MDCLFCKIIAGTIPCQKVTETERSFAFRDINPTAPTHVLVVPKEHIADASTVVPGDGASVADLVVTAQLVAAIDGITEGGYRLVFNVGADSGNSVGHLHLHVIGGRAMGWPPFPRN